MKGVILAGGTGSRLHPLTRITNKHLLPIFDRPMVTYAIEALVGAGVTEMMVVTGGTHAGEFLRLLGNGHEWGIDRLLYAYQEKPGGIAEALGLAQRFVEGDRVIMVLGDNIVEHSIRSCVERFQHQDKGARILLAEIENPEHLQHLGVPAFDGDRRLVKVVEKPSAPPSKYAVTGIYFYPASVFEVIPGLAPSGRGELEITDVNNWFISEGIMEYEVLKGFWGDAGEFVQTDVYGTYVLLEAARRYQHQCFLQVSTDEVYGDVREGRSKEDDPLRPRSPYAATKVGAEMLVNAYHVSFGVPTLITRGSNTYGPYQFPEKIIPLFITNALQDLALPIYGDGSAVREYLYVDDHVDGIARAL